jgi:transcriptional regulator with XRE-family HTH domain
MPDLSALFRTCRHALGLSAQGMAAALRVADGRTVRRWERGDRNIPGPAWIALQFLLRQAQQERLANEVDTALARADSPRADGPSLPEAGPH